MLTTATIDTRRSIWRDNARGHHVLCQDQPGYQFVGKLDPIYAGAGRMKNIRADSDL